MLFFNFVSEEKEFDYQLQIYSSLEIFQYKKSNSKDFFMMKKEFFSFIMPLYEFEYDLMSYGYIGINDIQVIIIMKTDNKSSAEVESKIIQLLKSIHNKYSKLIMNPFFNKSILESDSSNIKDKFVDNVISFVKNIKFE